MTSDDLQPQQAEQLANTVAAQLRYVNRLVERMQKLRFPPSDPLLMASLKAQDALQHLHVAARYAACKSGVAKPPRDSD